MTSKQHPDENLFYMMRRVLDLARREIDRQLVPQGLTNAQWVPIFKLFMKQAETAGVLARECGQDAGSMTRLLDRLEAKGLCQRERSGEDRRTVHVGLTDRGRQVARSISPVLERVEGDILKGFSAEEIRMLRSLLLRLLRSSM